MIAPCMMMAIFVFVMGLASEHKPQETTYLGIERIGNALRDDEGRHSAERRAADET